MFLARLLLLRQCHNNIAPRSMATPNKKCSTHFGPLQIYYDEDTVTGIWFLFLALNFALTGLIRHLVVGYCFPPPPMIRPVQAPTTPCPRCENIDYALLPPCPPAEQQPSADELLAEAKGKTGERPSIPRFILCTVLLLLSAAAMVDWAFVIQTILYCRNKEIAGTSGAKTSQFMYAFGAWLVYTCGVAWASSGLLCWAMWVRNLVGGEDAAERWPIRSNLGGVVLFGAFAVFVAVLGTPLILLWVLVLAAGRRLRTWWLEGLGRRITEGEIVEMEGVAGFESGSVIEEGIDKD